MTDKEDQEKVVRNSRDVKNVGQRRLLVGLGVLMVLSVLSLGVGGLLSYVALRGTAEDGTMLAQQIQKACRAPASTSPDLEQFCPDATEVVKAAPEEVKADSVPGPAGATGATGEAGVQGDPGPAPTDAQVLIAVRSFCTSTKACRGNDGADATPGQVAIAVSSYCNNRGECRGPAGTEGADGTNGTNGKDAAPITQAQIIAGVDSYCSQNNNCRGPAGADGTNGSDGADSTVPGPPGVVNVVDSCDAAGDGQVIADVDASYDAATQTVTINCSYKDDAVGGLLQNGSP